MFLEQLADSLQFLGRPGNHLLQFGKQSRGTSSGDYVFALSVNQKFAVKVLVTARWITRKCHSRRTVITKVAEHHGLHIDRRAPVVGNLVKLSISDRTIIVPRAKHCSDRPP